MMSAASAPASGAANAAKLGAGAAARETDAAAGPLVRDLVLLIEDNESVVLLLTMVLRRLGLRVHWCPCGAAALAAFPRHQHEIALVFSDCRLPDGDGREVCAALRQHAPELPVLVCSGNVRYAGLAPLRMDSRTGFLPKPYLPAELLACVRRLLGRPGADAVAGPGVSQAAGFAC